MAHFFTGLDVFTLERMPFKDVVGYMHAGKEMVESFFGGLKDGPGVVKVKGGKLPWLRKRTLK